MIDDLIVFHIIFIVKPFFHSSNLAIDDIFAMEFLRRLVCLLLRHYVYNILHPPICFVLFCFVLKN